MYDLTNRLLIEAFKELDRLNIRVTNLEEKAKGREKDQKTTRKVAGIVKAS